MADQWMIRGKEFANCNCAFGCPCQFNAPTTNGHCEAIGSVLIEEGHFNDIRLDGLNWAMVLWWPGEIADGKGRQQVFLDERGDADQREALRKILHGESTSPGSTHFFVYNSTMSEVLDPLFAPIEVKIDVEARKGKVNVPGLVVAEGNPMISPFTGEPARARIHLPDGFEYTYAEVANGHSKATAGLEIELSDSYAQCNILHMNQDGVIR